MPGGPEFGEHIRWFGLIPYRMGTAVAAAVPNHAGQCNSNIAPLV